MGSTPKAQLSGTSPETMRIDTLEQIVYVTRANAHYRKRHRRGRLKALLAEPRRDTPSVNVTRPVAGAISACRPGDDPDRARFPRPLCFARARPYRARPRSFSSSRLPVMIGRGLCHFLVAQKRAKEQQLSAGYSPLFVRKSLLKTTEDHVTNLKFWRLSNHLTQADAARRCGLGLSAYCLIEAGRLQPSQDQAASSRPCSAPASTEMLLRISAVPQ